MDTPNPQAMPLAKHLIELRKRLLWVIGVMVLGASISYFFVPQILNFLITPLAEAMNDSDTNRLITTGLTEGFFAYLKIAFFSGVFLTFPILLMQIWMFVAPGLYKQEKTAILPFLVATPILFFAGAACVYYVMIPMAWPFFLSFQLTSSEAVIPIQQETRVKEYLDLIMALIFAFGLCFQLPVFLTLLGRAGIVTAEFLSRYRKFAVIFAFILAAFLTPGDVLSLFILALPLWGLYELSILLVKMKPSS